MSFYSQQYAASFPCSAENIFSCQNNCKLALFCSQYLWRWVNICGNLQVAPCSVVYLSVHLVFVFAEQEKDQFVNKVLECLSIKSRNLASTSASDSEVQKATRLCNNLGNSLKDSRVHVWLICHLYCVHQIGFDFAGSLFDHAVSLVPSFLNEEDVQLLRYGFETSASCLQYSEIKVDYVLQLMKTWGSI